MDDLIDQGQVVKKRKGLIVVIIIASLILYLAGVFSGLIANNLVKQEAKKDLESLKLETEQYLKDLEKYIDLLDTNFKSVQLESTFTQTLNPKEKCKYSEISLNELVSQLGYYWDRLPYRIEDYERNNEVTDEYRRLKEQYTQLSIRIWILAKNQVDSCNTDMVHGLYFYSVDCEVCVAQGEELDSLNTEITSQSKDIILFPVDIDSDDPIIRNLRTFYSIDSTPALIINNNVFQGRLFRSEELIPVEYGAEVG
tara:strand:- start:5326 stop:6087 length:762 start_codon:yes stop_codon:yes gene_type:complete